MFIINFKFDVNKLTKKEDIQLLIRKQNKLNKKKRFERSLTEARDGTLILTLSLDSDEL